METRDRLFTVGILLWGAVLAFWLGRVYFLHPVDRIHDNHEAHTYVGRLLEFRDLLATGYLSPQWCTHFRGGLGSPYFHFYQPGFFYAASMVPWQVPPNRALGITVVAFALLGYVAMFGLVASRFGRLSAWLGASGLLLSAYVGTEIFIRGDLAEFSAMMTLPAALWALAGWLEYGKLRYLPWLAIAGGALVVLHPVVAMMSFGLFTLALAGYVLRTRQLRPVFAAAVALGVGIGLTTFYWLSVFFEWHLVTTEGALAEFYHYGHHFVHPLELLGPYNRQTIVPFSLGPVLVLLVVFNALVFWFRGQAMTVWQRRTLVFCLVALALFAWLMSPGSAVLWARIAPLARLQFPWRILSLVTVLAAAAAGSMLPWKNETIRAVVVGLVVLVMCGLSWRYTAYRLDPKIHAPAGVEELTRANFAPDLCNEWVPRGAQTDVPRRDRTEPVAGPGCRVDCFQRRQGRLSCRIRTTAESFVTLPHYFFPVGWKATLNGRPLELKADSRGLMRVDLPRGADGLVEVAFRQTLMRSLGLLISALSLPAGMGLLVAMRRTVQAEPPSVPENDRPA